jgi:hypothetical protein
VKTSPIIELHVPGGAISRALHFSVAFEVWPESTKTVHCALFGFAAAITEQKSLEPPTPLLNDEHA